MKSVVPSVKALVAKGLVEKHGFKQEEVARVLGISQSAISKYMRKVRGYVIDVKGVEEVEVLLQEITRLVLSGEYSRADFLRFFAVCVI